MTNDAKCADFTSRRKILIADADPIFFELAADHFIGSRTDLIRAIDPAQLVAALQCYPIDVVIVALSFSGANGIETIAECRLLTNVPIIALAASPNVENLRLALRAGATSFAVKPVFWQLFECQIEYILAHQ